MSGDVEREARNMGWLPEEEFKGNKDKWVDAEDFVEKGKHVLPILLQNNKRLQDQLLTRDQKIDNLTQSIEKLETHFTAANKRAVETAREQVRAQLKGELKAAREDEDVDAEVEVLEKLQKLDKPEPDTKQSEPAKGTNDTLDSDLSPEFKSWQDENKDWFGVDKKKTKLAVRIAEDIAEDEPHLKGRAFYDRCDELLAEQSGEKKDEDRSRPVSRTESGSRGTSRSTSSSYSSLPADAKQVCDSDADVFVGENKKFKTLDQWRAYYAKTYYGDE